ncbi:progonadoliberin-2 [Hyaena hyaena]|uniref:progonadoliberin-2 n=1 Tax=Hyaena hyaena TaxID=95912 RepID=UPI001921AC12|nr:progonadoliberin-2 [Hyaena hyaena]
MASFKLALLLLLLLTAHAGPSKAQHWSHGWYPGGKRASSSAQHPQHAPRLPASRPDQTALNLPSDALASPENTAPWEARTSGWWSLRRKQHLVQTLLDRRAGRQPGGRVQLREDRSGGEGAARSQLGCQVTRASAKMTAASPRRPDPEPRALQPSNKDVNSLKLLPRALCVVPSLAHPH